ncbi:MAG: MFS transporter [Acetobacteraceae bacterium]|nr:MFS transporter [Acetobacteraceae bacterium]MDW8396931.1 MFS transporter [Acetobacteraceae bacterium]
MTSPGWAAIRRLFGTPDFVRLWAIGGIANTMRWVEILVASLWTWQQTHSALAVALVAMMRAVPMLLLGAAAGAIADRMDRRLVLIALQAAATAGVGAVVLLGLAGRLAVWHLMAQGFVTGMAWAAEMATRRRMAADAAEPDDLVSAIALDTMTNSTTRAAGPLLGGLLFDAIGITTAFGIAFALHGAALWLAFRIARRPQPVAAGRPEFLAGIADAARIAGATPTLRGVLIATVAMNVFAFSYTTVLPAFGEVAFGASGTLIGLLAAAEPLGALAGGVLLALRRPAPRLAAFLGGAAWFCGGMVLAALSPAYALAWLLLFAGGFGTARFGSLQAALAMVAAPPEARSRMLGLVTTAIGTSPFGVLLAGALSDGAGPRVALVAMGALACAGVALAWRWGRAGR